MTTTHPRPRLRGRRLTLAATALCLASAFVACGSEDPSAEPSDASETGTSGPTHSASPSPTETPSEGSGGTDRGVLDVGDLEQGSAPGLAYAELAWKDGFPDGGVIHAPDGREVPLPPYGISEFVPFGNGWMVVVIDQDTGRESLISMSSDGEYDGRTRVSGGIAVSSDGGTIAWTSPDGTVTTADRTGERRTLGSVGALGPYRTVGIIGDDCGPSRSEDASCAVVVDTVGRRYGAYAVTSLGDVTSIDGMRTATTVSGTRVGGVHSVDDLAPSSCSRMTDRPDSRVLWETCDYTLDVVDPDGKTLVGLPSYLDGFGPDTLALVSISDGSTLQSWTNGPDSATYFDQVWEDSSHLLMRTYQSGEWAVVRVGLDGSLEYAVAPVAGEDLASPILLQTR